jgi:hypothetical protein
LQVPSQASQALRLELSQEPLLELCLRWQLALRLALRCLPSCRQLRLQLWLALQRASYLRWLQESLQEWLQESLQDQSREPQPASQAHATACST